MFTSCPNVILCPAGVKQRLTSVSLTPVETEAPAWIDSTCLCVNARLATVVPPVTWMYVRCTFFFSIRRTRQEMYILHLLPNTNQFPGHISAKYVAANHRDWNFCCKFYVSVFHFITWHLCAYGLVRHKTHLVTFKHRSCSWLKGLFWSPQTWQTMPEVSFKNIRWFYSQMFKHSLDQQSLNW